MVRIAGKETGDYRNRCLENHRIAECNGFQYFEYKCQYSNFFHGNPAEMSRSSPDTCKHSVPRAGNSNLVERDKGKDDAHGRNNEQKIVSRNVNKPCVRKRESPLPRRRINEFIIQTYHICIPLFSLLFSYNSRYNFSAQTIQANIGSTQARKWAIEIMRLAVSQQFCRQCILKKPIVIFAYNGSVAFGGWIKILHCFHVTLKRIKVNAQSNKTMQNVNSLTAIYFGQNFYIFLDVDFKLMTFITYDSFLVLLSFQRQQHDEYFLKLR